MKKFIVQTMLFLSFALSYTVSSAQTPATCCPKKGTADCPLIQNCPKKGAADCPYAAGSTAKVIQQVKADCPLAGTAECPLEKCPQKGTAECPLIKGAMQASYASNNLVAKAPDEDLPPCCRKK